MPATLKGPGLFLAQFSGDAAPFDTLDRLCGWAAGLGYKGVQMPTWDRRLFDLARAAESQTYCDEVAGTVAAHGLAITELSTHLQGQLVAVNPAYDAAFDALGDGQVDFGGIFSRLAAHGYDSWAVLEWECCLKHPEDGAREGAAFIAAHIIRVTERAFDDFAGSVPDEGRNRRMLGLG